MGRPSPSPVDSGGVSLLVRRAGSGPALVALHGGPGLDHHVLVPLGERLATSFETWLADLPGHGGSPARRDHVGLETLVDGTDRWLGNLDTRVEVLVGHSLGALVVLELLRRRPGRVRAAALLAPATEPPSPSAVRAATGHVSASPRASRERGLRELLVHVHSEVDGDVAPEVMETLRAGRVRPSADYPAVLRDLHALLARPPRPFDPACPVLVACGARDRTTPPERAAELARSVAGARFELLEGSGHYPFLDRATATAERIVRFLHA